MRTTKDIMKNLKVYFTKEGKIYAVQDNYSHSLKLIEDTLEYLKTINITIPDKNCIEIQILRGERYNRIMSIEFTSSTLPEENNQCWLLTKDSGVWKWLVY